jgi:hypothetical protein
MYPLIGWGVSILFQKVFGRTWTSAIASSSAVTWTTTQLYRSIWLQQTTAMTRLAYAGQMVWTASVGNVLTGAALGVAGGIGVSYLLFGEEGKDDAIDLYTGKVSFAKAVETIAAAPRKVAAITAGNRAVPNNAAGMIVGQSIYTKEGWFSQTSQHNPTMIVEPELVGEFNTPTGRNPFAYGDGPAWYA